MEPIHLGLSLSSAAPEGSGDKKRARQTARRMPLASVRRPCAGAADAYQGCRECLNVLFSGALRSCNTLFRNRANAFEVVFSFGQSLRCHLHSARHRRPRNSQDLVDDGLGANHNVTNTARAPKPTRLKGSFRMIKSRLNLIFVFLALDPRYFSPLVLADVVAELCKTRAQDNPLKSAKGIPWKVCSPALSLLSPRPLQSSRQTSTEGTWVD